MKSFFKYEETKTSTVLITVVLAARSSFLKMAVHFCSRSERSLFICRDLFPANCVGLTPTGHRM